MINLNKVTIQVAAKFLLEDASIQIPDGAKLGIVGANGCGKTTLFKVLRGLHDVFSGEVFVPRKQHQAFAEQEIKETDLNKPILQYVLDKDERLYLLREREKNALPEELPEIIEQLKIIEADSAEARTAEILTGLSFNQEDLSRPVKDFSGGWQMRLNLAGALFQSSDILFLDEPTNHLDLEAIIWLENYLRKYRGTLLLISHDQDFLNNVCTSILHFEGHKLTLYSGNYDNFIKQYTAKIELTGKAIKKQNERKAHLQSYIDRFRYKATKARQAQSRIKMLEKIQDIAEITEDKESHFEFPQIKPLPSPMIKVENASVGYDEKVVLKKLNFVINQDDRIALLGKNGNGKSTLVKMLFGSLPIKEGNINKLSKLKIGYFNQNQTETLPLNQTPTEYIQSLLPDKAEHLIRAHLGCFGLEQEKAITKINQLSGGEKTRLLFARISIDSPELLIFDEPTNHLDIAGRKALAEAINAYQGAVILISHDFHLLEMVADTLWLVNNHTVKPFEGDLNDYRNFLLADYIAINSDKKEKQKKMSQSSSTPKVDRKIRVQIREIEQSINNLEYEKNKILNDFSTISESSKIIILQKELNRVEKQIKELEDQWFELSEKQE